MAPSSVSKFGMRSQSTKLNVAEMPKAKTCACADKRRARARKFAPIAGDTSADAAIDKPMPIEVEKNRIELA